MKALFFLLIISSVGCSQLRQTKLKEKNFGFETRWIQNTVSFDDLDFRHQNRMTPVVLNRLVIQGNGHDRIAAYDRSNGQERWRLMVENGVEGGAQVVDDKLYFGGGDANFYSVQVETGKVLWKFETKAQVLSAPYVKNQIVYFLGGDNTVYALDAKTGEQKWLYRRNQSSRISVRSGSRPIVQGRTLYIGMSDGALVALDISDGRLLWDRQLKSQGRFLDIDSTPIIAGGRIFVSSYDGSLFSLSQKDGQILWRHERGGNEAVTLVNDQLFLATSEGEVQALNRETGKLQWAYKLEVGVATQPKFYRGFVVFGESQGPIRVLSAKTGERVARFVTGRGVIASPKVMKNGELYVISNEGNLYALQMGRF